MLVLFFFFQAEDGIRDYKVTGVQTCALPIFLPAARIERRLAVGALHEKRGDWHAALGEVEGYLRSLPDDPEALAQAGRLFRSEERRVGKEWRSRRWARHHKNKERGGSTVVVS